MRNLEINKKIFQPSDCTSASHGTVLGTLGIRTSCSYAKTGSPKTFQFSTLSLACTWIQQQFELLGLGVWSYLLQEPLLVQPKACSSLECASAIKEKGIVLPTYERIRTLSLCFLWIGSVYKWPTNNVLFLWEPWD